MAAAVLSHRDISDRYLPDKAIDLVDEAAARLRTEIDSMPAELDEISRRVMPLEIEREALREETDAASGDRLGKLEEQLTRLQAEAQTLRGQWEREKASIEHPTQLRKRIEETRVARAEGGRSPGDRRRGRAAAHQGRGGRGGHRRGRGARPAAGRS